MEILRIKDILRTDSPIYYRMFYTGIIELDLMSKKVERQINFSVETMPTGHKLITATLAEPVDYPLVPLLRQIKAFILALSEAGGLPV